MRNALILLAVVALLILAVGAFNNGTAFDVDYVAGTVSSVSLFWVSAVLAALVFVVGLAAAWFAQAAMTGSRRKLEAELQSTYERLREAEALAARPAPAAAAPAAEAVAVTVVAGREEATVVAATEAATVAETDTAGVVAGEAATAEGGESAIVRARRGRDGGRRGAGRRGARRRRAGSRDHPRRADRHHHGRYAAGGRRFVRGAPRARAPRTGPRRTPPARPASPPPERRPAASVASGRYTRAVMHS